MKTFFSWSIPLVLAAVLLSAGAAAQEKPIVSLPYNHYYSHAEIGSLLRDFEKKYDRFLSLQSIGKSTLGREIWVMTVNNPDTGPEDQKAAMYIDANIHGNEVQGAEAVIYTLDYLMTNYGHIDRVTDLVDTYVFYLLPMVNPDGRMHWFDTSRFSGGGRSGMQPTDDDNDGLFDEDGYDDIDGDGYILRMRKKVENGDYIISPEDPRLMERAAPGQTGDYIMLGTEGIDNDGDGRINEDGAGGYDMNRNWPADWQPDYIQSGAGTRPFSYPETEAIGTFFLSHPNIAGVQSYHNSGGMILRGPGSKDEEPYSRSDLQVYDYIGREGEKILPFYRYYVIYEDLYTVHGGFINWTAEGLGIFSFSNELWSSRQYYNSAVPEEDRSSRGNSGQKERLFFDDHVEMGRQFIEWKPAVHPQYGNIELGGWARETGRVPPMFMLEELCHRNTMFTLFHAEQMPVVAIDTISVTSLGRGSYRVWVTIRNSKVIPTISDIAAKRHLVTPDILSLEGKSSTVTAAGFVRDIYTGRTDPVENRYERVAIPGGIPGQSAVTVQFIVSGAGRCTAAFVSSKGGKTVKTFMLQ
ncbi:peptidase M14 [bacterium]|nr:peptidase M14 [bacterium]